MPVNVLYIIDSLTHGGTEKQLVQLMGHLDPEKVRPHLCTLKTSEGLYDELDMPKVCLDYVSFVHPAIIKNVAGLVSFVRRHKIDIVQTFFQDPFLMGAMIKPFTGVKLVGSFRDLGFWRSPAETRKMRLAYPFFSGFIANSEAVKEHFALKDGIRAGKIEVIYNGIDLEAINPGKTEETLQSPPVVGIVANLNRPVKRVQDFIRAAGIVHKKNPDVRFVVVGDGYLRGELEELGNTLGLEDVLSFTGRLANPLKVVPDFHVGVITSESEGFCNAILEYMACGVPVVATDSGGNRELVEEGENGFLVPVGSPERLGERIMQLLRDDRFRTEMGRCNQKKVAQKFSMGSMAERNQNYYRAILAC